MGGVVAQKTRTYFEADMCFQSVVGSLINALITRPLPAREHARATVDLMRQGQVPPRRAYGLGATMQGQEGQTFLEAMKTCIAGAEPRVIVIGDTIVVGGVDAARAKCYMAPDVATSDRKINSRMTPKFVAIFLRLAGWSRRETRDIMSSIFTTQGAADRTVALAAGMSGDAYSVVAPAHSFVTTANYLALHHLAKRFKREPFEPQDWELLSEAEKTWVAE